MHPLVYIYIARNDTRIVKKRKKRKRIVYQTLPTICPCTTLVN